MLALWLLVGSQVAHGWVLPASAARHDVELLLFSCIPGPRNLGQCLVWWWQTARCQRVGSWLIVPSRPRSLGVEPSVSSTESGLERFELVGNLLLKLYSGLANRPHQPFFSFDRCLMNFQWTLTHQTPIVMVSKSQKTKHEEHLIHSFPCRLELLIFHL